MARKISHHDERYNVIVVGEKGYELQTESYNRLKDNVLFFNIDGKTKVIQILSSVPSEGKTVTTTNLHHYLLLKYDMHEDFLSQHRLLILFDHS